MTANVVIEQHGPREATVTSCLTLLIAFSPTDHPTLQSTGIHTDTVVLERDAVWRIKERVLKLDTPSQPPKPSDTYCNHRWRCAVNRQPPDHGG